MHERDKLDEAKFFLNQLKASLFSPQTFNWYVSAFLAAARSVLQYAEKEAKNSNAAHAWYQKAVQDKFVKFFKVQRDISIHQQPIKPQKATTVTAFPTIDVSFEIEVRDQQGKVVQKQSSPKRTNTKRPPVISHTYVFNDGKNSHDVITYSENYLAALEAIVNDGISKGHIAG